MPLTIAGPIHRRRIDWAAVIIDLRRLGCATSRAATIIGTDVSNLNNWMRGVEPKHCDGVALLELHQQVCGEIMFRNRIAQAKVLE